MKIRKITDLDSFKNHATEKHGGKFNYEKFKYTTAKTKSTIICPIHGEFLQSATDHMNSIYGCFDCGRVHINEATKRRGPPEPKKISKEEYISRFIKKFGNIFELDMENYKTLTTGTVTIKCEYHGEITNTPQSFLITTHACPKCGWEEIGNKLSLSYDEFLSRCTALYGDKYNYPSKNKEIYKNG